MKLINKSKSDIWDDGWLTDKGTLFFDENSQVTSISIWVPSLPDPYNELVLQFIWGENFENQQKFSLSGDVVSELAFREPISGAQLKYKSNLCFLPTQEDKRVRSARLLNIKFISEGV